MARGVDGAYAGIVMPAHPKPGLVYRQEYYKGQAEDQGEVLSVNSKVTVPFGTFEHTVQTKDSTALEPGVVEYKYYARGVGHVLRDGRERRRARRARELHEVAAR